MALMIYDEAADEHLWVVVMARDHVRNVRGAPLQYATNGNSVTQFQRTLDRAAAWSVPRRIVPVVARGHEPWWRTEQRIFGGTTVFHPIDRGDAPDLIIALCTIAKLDPAAKILVMCSSDSFEQEWDLSRAIHRALVAVEKNRHCVTLIAQSCIGDATSRHWIVPGAADRCGLQRVREMTVPRSHDDARALKRSGAMVATKTLVSRLSALLALLEIVASPTLRLIRGFCDRATPNGSPCSIDELYSVIRHRIALFEALSHAPEMLHVVAADETARQEVRYA